nr:unnamed protein product [Callosobruchus analis]
MKLILAYRLPTKMPQIESGYKKASSDNLPCVDSAMIQDFFASNSDFVSAEVRHVKTKKSSKEAYGDNAVSYVQLKREGSLCFIKGKITPEHKTKQASYTVVAVINEQEEEVERCICEDCAASAGGCKHAVAFLLWLNRRTEEPSVTSTQCYWKKSKLSTAAKTDVDIATLFATSATNIPQLGPLDSFCAK